MAGTFKKIIAAMSAMAMLMTSSITANVASASDETRYPFPLEDYLNQNIKLPDIINKPTRQTQQKINRFFFIFQ